MRNPYRPHTLMSKRALKQQQQIIVVKVQKHTVCVCMHRQDRERDAAACGSLSSAREPKGYKITLYMRAERFLFVCICTGCSI
jgi:hypothetical protein